MRSAAGLGLVLTAACARPVPGPRLVIQPAQLAGGIALAFDAPVPASDSVTYSPIDSTRTYRYRPPAATGISTIDVPVNRDGHPYMFRFDYLPGVNFDSLAQRYAQWFGVPGTSLGSSVAWVDSDKRHKFALSSDSSGRLRAYLVPYLDDGRDIVAPDPVKLWELCMDGYWPLCMIERP